jgi:hypothetical protein
VLPYHRGDYKQLPDEDKVLGTLRTAGVKRGVYMFPYCTHKDMKSEATIQKQKQGPVGSMTIFPSGPVNMAKYLVLWFIYCVLVSLFAAYLAGHTIMPGVHPRAVLRVTGIAAFLAYGIGQLTNGIWAGQPWSITLKHVFDGLVYSVVTAGTFVWLWPR